MSLSRFDLLKLIFGGEKIREDKRQALYAETMFMVLSGAARADLNIEPVELKRIHKILRNKLDQDISEHDIQLAGETELFETAPIQKYVSRASRFLTVEQRQEVLRAMIEVFLSDGVLGPLEKAYFDSIVDALHLKPSEMLAL
ncbi:MAG: TerB family tellurite resistance protein [Gammaproteobacteria bacterium]|nr:TerB family tellurite resistance protein [Gammaproteobacteria bacterium]MBT8149876.1 TerB family tellurite resistance protein [Gammaproteobacteria bacterium]NNL10995.1 hypothetical protein [Pseudomonadales bacterium]NNM11177.1 hypothetical protein [Pseudomonadales bacterium]